MKQEFSITLKDFEVENVPEEPTAEELFQLLSKQVEYMLQYKTEYLFSLLYRMDVQQPLVEAALAPDAPIPAHVGIAKLVMDRQKQRNATREFYRQAAIDDLDEELKY